MNRDALFARGFGALLLRLVLAFAVALGGASGASAMPSMPSMPSMAHSSGPAKCHGPEHLVASASGATEHVGHPDSGPQLPDCCSPSACACACVHGIGVAMPALVGMSVGIVYARPVSPPHSGYASPALPPLLEPPIG